MNTDVIVRKYMQFIDDGEAQPITCPHVLNDTTACHLNTTSSMETQHVDIFLVFLQLWQHKTLFFN